MPTIKGTPATYGQWIVKQRPLENHRFELKDVFELQEVPCTIDESECEGKFLVRQIYFSHDPAQRNWISVRPEDSDPGRNYMAPFHDGGIARGGGIGEIVASWNPEYHKGERVMGLFGWTEYAVVDPRPGPGSLLPPRKVPPGITPEDYLANNISAWTAYLGLYKVAEATGKEATIVVSAAAGATGSTVCQLAKNVIGIKTVIGIAGGQEKCTFLKSECAVDIALDYRSPTFEQELKDATSEYINIYFDNVGGKILNYAVARMAKYGRIVQCGSISNYGQPADGVGLTRKNVSIIAIQSLTYRGFVALDYAQEFPQTFMTLMALVQQGKVKLHRTLWEHGFEELPQGMMRLLDGENRGKLISKIRHS